MADLQHAFGSLEVAQLVLTEVEERHAVERVRRELGRRVRDTTICPPWATDINRAARFVDDP